MYDVQITVEADEALIALMGLDYAVSSVGLAQFLSGTPEHYIQARAMERFENEGDDASGGWEPLKDSTLRIREQRGFAPGPINVRTGQLYEYMVDNQGQVNPTGVGAELRYPGNQPSDMHTLFAFATAQQGSSHWGTPARPVAAVSETDLAMQLALLHGWVVAGIQMIRVVT